MTKPTSTPQETNATTDAAQGVQAAVETKAGQSASPSLVAPLRHRWFAVLWTAALFSNMGSWMNEVGVAWQMTLMTDSLLLISLVQTATTAPVFLLAVLAGALTDLLDRRRYLLAIQLIMLGVASGLAALTFLDLIEPWSMIFLTFLLGIGSALTMPGWQAIVPGLVPKPLVGRAVALNSVNINLARAVGPATAGIIIAQAGSAWVFVANALSFAIIAVCLWVWPFKRETDGGRSERLASAMISGLRYIFYAPDFRQVLIRIFLFTFPAGAFWGLLPAIGRDGLGVDAGGYGLLIGAIGFGAVGAATQFSRLQAWLGNNGVAVMSTLLFAAGMVLIGHTSLFVLALACALSAGAAWLLVLTTYNTAAQLLVPNWIRGRAMSVYLVCFFGGLSVGSMAWGAMASLVGISTTVIIAAAIQVAGIALILRQKLPKPADGALERSTIWHEHQHPTDVERTGAVLVTRRYQVRLDAVQKFTEAVHQLRTVRRREGAISWGVFKDEHSAVVFIEQFLHPDWDTHLRSHERYTQADEVIERDIESCLVPGTQVEVNHLLEVDLHADDHFKRLPEHNHTH